MGTTLFYRPQRAAFREPVPFRICYCPLGSGGLLVVRHPLVWRGDPLKDVVHILCDSENTGFGLWNYRTSADEWEEEMLDLPYQRRSTPV